MALAGDVLRLQSGARYAVFVDFDGMVAPDDPTDSLLYRYADPSWRQLEAEWQQGRLSSRECMASQVELLRMTPNDLVHFVKGIRVDPDFPPFVEFCKAQGAEVTVVSDGMDSLVAAALRQAGLTDVPFYANALEWQGGDRWRLRFPYTRLDCRWNMGNCKCGHLPSRSSKLKIMVGDGRSDFCIADACDFTLAKGTLAVHCREHDLPHAAIANFAEALEVLSGWLYRRNLRTAGSARRDLPRVAH
jgi:2,3-diketo-5-methylthio-1-phosphopentane phosphatase